MPKKTEIIFNEINEARGENYLALQKINKILLSKVLDYLNLLEGLKTLLRKTKIYLTSTQQ